MKTQFYNNARTKSEKIVCSAHSTRKKVIKRSEKLWNIFHLITLNPD